MGRYDRIIEVDELEEIEKFNPYHGRDGRFSSSNGSGGAGMAGTNYPNIDSYHVNRVARAKDPKLDPYHGASGAGANYPKLDPYHGASGAGANYPKLDPDHGSDGAETTGGKYQKLSQKDAVAMAGEMGQNDIPQNEVKRMLDRDEGYFGTPNSFTINEKLRINDPAKNELAFSDEELKTIKTLDKNMRPSTQDVQIYRMVGNSFLKSMGIDAAALQHFDEKKMQKAVGKVYPNDGYTSTSFDMTQNVFDFKPVKMNINAPKGTQMLVSPARDDYWAGKNAKHVSEAEILLARGTAMKITAIRPRIQNGRPYGIEVDCEVLID